MKKNELISAVASRTGLSRSDVRATIVATNDVIHEAISKGDGVFLFGLGKLVVKHRPPRKARNIHTGEPATVPDRNVVLFRASEPLIEAAQKAPKQ